MSNNLNAGDLALVIPGKGANNVRSKPNGTVTGQIPEHAVLAILSRPADWTNAYPYNDGIHVWWYVRGKTDKKPAADRFEVIEGWTAANENNQAFLQRWESAVACLDTMGTALDTHLQAGQEAYVLPPDGLNIRSEADPHATRVGGLLQGKIVTVTGKPRCDTKMVWWQMQRIGVTSPVGWVSEGSGLLSSDLEWYLAPLTLE